MIAWKKKSRPNRTPEVVEQLFFGAQGTGVYSESTARTFDVDTGEEVIQRNGNASGVQGRGLAPAGAVSPVGGGRDQPGAEVASGGALGALFSPPMDIVFKGDFSSAMMRAASQSKWLLVNIQSPDEFKCLILNRSVPSSCENRKEPSKTHKKPTTKRKKAEKNDSKDEKERENKTKDVTERETHI